MSSAFLKGMLHGQAGSEHPPLWENEQSWTGSRDALEHKTALEGGEKEEQER